MPPRDSHVSAIVLAAGKAERLGCCKLSLSLTGQSILSRVLASGVTEVVVVLGHHATELAPEIPRDARVKIVYNPRYEDGQHPSLKAGLDALDRHSQAVAVLLGDQPFVPAEVIDAVIAEFSARRAPLVLPVYQGRRGPPGALRERVVPRAAGRE